MSFKKWLLQNLRRAIGMPEVTERLKSLASTAHRFEGITNRSLSELQELRDFVTELQRSSNYGYQDIIVLLNQMTGLGTKSVVRLETEHPVAVKSGDHRFPRGVAHDNTRYPRFCQKCEKIFQRKVRLLDLGCAGGGLVWDFLLRGHFAIGLEGSDYPLKNQRSEWRTIPNHLFTCDITKPFCLVDENTQAAVRFDVISAWEVLEHIHEQDLPGLFANVHQHLDDGGLFVNSVATFSDYDEKTKVVYHVTIKDRDWWEALFRKHNFELVYNLFDPLDFPRGSGNGRYDWSALTNPELGFHIVARPIRG